MADLNDGFYCCCCVECLVIGVLLELGQYVDIYLGSNSRVECQTISLHVCRSRPFSKSNILTISFQRNAHMSNL